MCIRDRPGVVSGITMVFVPSVSTFYISQKLGGGKFLLLGDSIEMQFQSAYNYNLGASLSLVLMMSLIHILYCERGSISFEFFILKFITFRASDACRHRFAAAYPESVNQCGNEAR